MMLPSPGGKAAETERKRERESWGLWPFGISKGTRISDRVWRTAGRDQCVKYSNGKFRQPQLNGTRNNIR